MKKRLKKILKSVYKQIGPKCGYNNKLGNLLHDFLNYSTNLKLYINYNYLKDQILTNIYAI